MHASRRAGTWPLYRRQRSENVTTGIKIRHPEVTVQLTGTDGNAFAVLGAVKNALAGAGVSEAEQAEFCSEVTAGTTTGCSRPACAGWTSAR